MDITKICILGADIIGCSTATAIALKCPHINVTVMDDNLDRVMQWKLDTFPSNEPGLENAVKECRNQNLSFTFLTKKPVTEADVIFVCAHFLKKSQKPGNCETHTNTMFLENSARFIASCVDSPKIIVERSTLHIRAAETLKTILDANKSARAKFNVVSNPPFLLEGSIMQDLIDPHRVVIGGDKTSEGDIAVDLISSIYEHWVPRSKIIITDIWSAELSRISTNAFLAQKICSINSLLEICEVTNADITEVVSIVGKDARIGSAFLNPFDGFAGTVFHKDVAYLVNLCKTLNLPEVGSYWQKVLDMNQYQKKRLIQLVNKCFFNTLTGKKVAIFGLTTEKNLSGLSDSPAFYICKSLLIECAQLKICEPNENREIIKKEVHNFCLSNNLENFIKRITITNDPYEAAEGAHGIVVCSDLVSFTSLDYNKIYEGMIKPACIFDTRKVLAHQKLKEIGFNIHTIGKTLKKPLLLF